ncbi:hypothetical protein JCM11641_005699 [Rhodosporidiobolus odoratus]
MEEDLANTATSQPEAAQPPSASDSGDEIVVASTAGTSPVTSKAFSKVPSPATSDKPNANSANVASQKRANSTGVTDDAATEDGVTGKATAGPAKKKRKSEAKSNTVYCHQDHQAHPVSEILRCTSQKPAAGRNSKLKQCSIAYCSKCLDSRYGEDAAAIVERGEASTWSCPSCRGLCNCASCRKKKGLESTGSLKKLAKEQGMSNAADLLNVTPSARSAAQKANTKLSATFAANGKMAALPLSKSSPNGTSKRKKAKKEKKPTDGNGSDSSLSSLADSDQEDDDESTLSSDHEAGAKPKKTKKAAAPSASKSPSAPTEKKERRVNQPRAPPPLASPPTTYPLASLSYTSAHLPCTEAVLARFNLREFLLRFLAFIPSLAPNAKRPPTAQHARTLSALCDEVLWLWSDNDLAAETTQLTLLGGLAELILKEKFTTWTVDKRTREYLQDVKSEVEQAKNSFSGKLRDKPWDSAKAALGKDNEWVEVGKRWSEEYRKRAGIVVDQKFKKDVKGKGKGEADDGGDSDLSSLSGDSSDEGEADQPASTLVGDEDDEIDMLASDYDEEEEQAKKKARRGKFERETSADERLALCCGLVDLAIRTELVRNEMAEGTKTATADAVELNKKRYKLKHDLQEDKQRILDAKPVKPSVADASSEQVKEWKEAVDKVDEDVKDAEIRNTKETWRVQHDLYLATVHHRTRFSSLGTDALSNTYYAFSPPPPDLLKNPASAASSGFPLNRPASNDVKADYPLSYCIVGYGKRPVAPPFLPPPDVQRAAAAAAKGKGKEKDQQGLQLDTFEAKGADEWFVICGLADIDDLATFLDSTLRHAKHAHALAEHRVAYPPDPKNNTSHKSAAEIERLKKLIPKKAEVERLKNRVERADEGLGEQVRQFAAYVRHVRELAAEEAEEWSEMRSMRDR